MPLGDDLSHSQLSLRLLLLRLVRGSGQQVGRLLVLPLHELVQSLLLVSCPLLREHSLAGVWVRRLSLLDQEGVKVETAVVLNSV